MLDHSIRECVKMWKNHYGLNICHNSPLWEVWEKMIYTPKFTSTGGLGGNKFYLPEIVNGCMFIRHYGMLLWTTERAKEINKFCL